MPRAASNHYLVTIFNIPDNKIFIDAWKNRLNEQITPKARITYVAGGLEVCPETEQVHAHIYFQCGYNVTLGRIREWIKQYEDADSGHIYSFGSGGDDESPSFFCKGSSDDCVKYVLKTETALAEFDKFEVGNVLHIKGSSRPGRGTRTDLLALKESIDDGKENMGDLMNSHFETVAKYKQFTESYIFHVKQSRIYTQQLTLYSGATLRPWQQTLYDRLKGPVDPRKVHWYWEMTGNVGKSFMAAYATFVAGAITVPIGKLHDMCYVLSKDTYPIYIIDIPRTYADKLDHVFTLVEMIKSGKMCSYKYESKIMLLEPAHVVIFSNFPPNLDSWSPDRYDINNIS